MGREGAPEPLNWTCQTNGEFDMSRLVVASISLILLGCQTPTNIEGAQTYYDGNKVIIDGLNTPTPTQAEQLNAEEGCSGPATFQSSEPAGQGFYRLTFTCD